MYSWSSSTTPEPTFLTSAALFYISDVNVRPNRFWGRGRGVPRQTDGGGECHLFLAGIRPVVLGNQCFSWREIAWPPSLFIFSKTNVRQSWSFKHEKNYLTSNERGEVVIVLSSGASVWFDSQKGEKFSSFFFTTSMRVFSEINKYRRKQSGAPLLGLT